MVSGNDFAGAVLHGRSVVVVACAGSGSSHHLPRRDRDRLRGRRPRTVAGARARVLSDRRHAFGAVRPPLERRATVYALDRRGHGDSEDALAVRAAVRVRRRSRGGGAVPGPVDRSGIPSVPCARSRLPVRPPRSAGWCSTRECRATGGRSARTVWPSAWTRWCVRDGRGGARRPCRDRAPRGRPAGPGSSGRELVGVGGGVAVLDRELRVENGYRFAPERYADMIAPTLMLAGAESAPRFAPTRRRWRPVFLTPA